jgi:hypothetical protein
LTGGICKNIPVVAMEEITFNILMALYFRTSFFYVKNFSNSFLVSKSTSFAGFYFIINFEKKKNQIFFQFFLGIYYNLLKKITPNLKKKIIIIKKKKKKKKCIFHFSKGPQILKSCLCIG